MVLFTLSLTGLLLTQFYWIKGGFKAADETFKQMNTIALRSVLQQAPKIIHYHHLNRIGERIDSDRDLSLDSIFSLCGFGALIRNEFNHYKVHEDFEFGIIDNLTGKLSFSSAEKDRTNLILQSKFIINLRPAIDSERYSVVVWFPHEKMVILKEQNSWLLILSILLFAGIVAGYFLSVSTLISQKKLAEIQRDFINNTTHEFKTPLATISVAAEMIRSHRKDMPDSQLDKYASIIYEENKRIQRQVDQILQIALLDNDNYKYYLKPVDLQKTLEKCVDTGRIILREKGGSICLEGKCKRPIIADQLHITNVINNLIENGIKYSNQAPEIIIRIKENSKGVNIYFYDNGVGIEQDKIKYIFDRMYRVPSGDIYNTPGAGLGLYYVKKVVEAHQGSVTVKSKIARGSVFNIFLPHKNDS